MLAAAERHRATRWQHELEPALLCNPKCTSAIGMIIRLACHAQHECFAEHVLLPAISLQVIWKQVVAANTAALTQQWYLSASTVVEPLHARMTSLRWRCRCPCPPARLVLRSDSSCRWPLPATARTACSAAAGSPGAGSVPF